MSSTTHTRRMAVNVMSSQQILELEAKYEALGKEIAMAKLIRDKHEEITQVEAEFEDLKRAKDALETSYRDEHALLSAKVASANAKLTSLKDCLVQTKVPKKPVKKAKVAKASILDIVSDVALDECSEDSLHLFNLRKMSYFRIGHLDAEQEYVWHSRGDLWFVNEDGSPGSYAGILIGKYRDESPEAMADEPILLFE